MSKIYVVVDKDTRVASRVSLELIEKGDIEANEVAFAFKRSKDEEHNQHLLDPDNLSGISVGVYGDLVLDDQVFTSECCQMVNNVNKRYALRAETAAEKNETPSHQMR